MSFEDDDICRNKHGGNDESEEANENVDKTKGQRMVLDYLEMMLAVGGTADEVAAHYGCAHNATSPRMTELKVDKEIVGQLDEDGRKLRRLTRSNCPARVFVLPQYLRNGVK